MRENKEIKIVTEEISYPGNLEEWREVNQKGDKERGLLNRHNVFFSLLLRSLVSLQKQNDPFLHTLDIL